MKYSNNNNSDYYPRTSQDRHSMARSVSERRYNISRSKDNTNKFQARIGKVCTTNYNESYKKEVALLRKQIEKLQKQNLKKDNKLLKMQSSNNSVKQIESQLEETYRIIYMYEGRIQQLQVQLKRFQRKIAENIQSTLTAQQIESLLNQYRNDNTELRGTLQEQNRIIMQLQQKLRTIQSKYFQAEWKLSNQNRIIANPLKKRFPKLRDEIAIHEMSLSAREKMMNQVQQRYQENKKLSNAQSSQKVKESVQLKTNNNKKLYNQQASTKKLQGNRLTDIMQTPPSAIMSKQYIPGVSTTIYTTEKVKSSAKVSTEEYTQEWESYKQDDNSSQLNQIQKRKQNKKRGQKSQNASLNYSLPDGLSNILQIGPSQFLETTQKREISKLNNFGQQIRDGSCNIQSSYSSMASSQKPQGNSNVQRIQASYNPSSKFIRIIRKKNQSSQTQNQQKPYFPVYKLDQQLSEANNTRQALKPS